MGFFKKYKFSDDPKIASITCKHIIDEKADIMYVSHDYDDGGWQFLCGSHHDEGDARIIGLGEMVKLHPELNQFHNLPLGVFAERSNSSSNWELYGTDEQWYEVLSNSNTYLNEQQEILKETYQLGEHERFDWDQEKGTLVFSNDGIAEVEARIQFVGSISKKSNTWLWSWANSNMLDHMKDQVEKVKDFGEDNSFQNLTIDKWDADETDGWEMTAIAAWLLKAKGAYRTQSDDTLTYMIITDINWLDQ